MAEYIEFEKDHHPHHHKETFITKYVFSQDHKMIAAIPIYRCIFYGNYWNFDVNIDENANCMA